VNGLVHAPAVLMLGKKVSLPLPGIEPWAPNEWPSHFLDLTGLPRLPLLLPTATTKLDLTAVVLTLY
jgi:hypothetical protein